MPQSFNPKTGERLPGGGLSPIEMLANLDELMTTRQPPPLPGAPSQFTKPTFNPAEVERAMSAIKAPPLQAAAPESSAPPGVTYDRSADFGPSREAFLAGGDSPEIGMMADAMQARSAIDENMMSGRRPDLLNAERNRLAIGGLRQSMQRGAQQLDPNFGRTQRREDAISEAETYADPRVAGARQMQQREGLSGARARQNLDIEGKTDPRVLWLMFQKFLQEQSIAKTAAQGRNPLAGMLGMGGGAQQGGPEPQIGERATDSQGRVVVWDGQGWAYQD